MKKSEVKKKHGISPSQVGLLYVMVGIIIISLNSVVVKLESKYMSSEETVFWRCFVALLLNLVRYGILLLLHI